MVGFLVVDAGFDVINILILHLDVLVIPVILAIFLVVQRLFILFELLLLHGTALLVRLD